MSKAVLVMEMPVCCNGCPICRGISIDDGKHVCSIPDTDGNVHSHYGKYSKPDWCPLKEMLERNDNEYFSDYARGYKHGWNDAINAIDSEV